MTETTMSAFGARRKFGKVLDTVAANVNNVIIERHGEPVAAVIPMTDYRKLQRERDEAFARLRHFYDETAARANLTPEEAEQLVSDVVSDVRATRRAAAATAADQS